MSSRHESYPNITFELRRFYECFHHSANSQALVFHITNQIASECSIKTWLWSDTRCAQVIPSCQPPSPLFLATFLRIPLSKFLWGPYVASAYSNHPKKYQVNYFMLKYHWILHESAGRGDDEHNSLTFCGCNFRHDVFLMGKVCTYHLGRGCPYGASVWIRRGGPVLCGCRQQPEPMAPECGMTRCSPDGVSLCREPPARLSDQPDPHVLAGYAVLNTLTFLPHSRPILHRPFVSFSPYILLKEWSTRIIS